MRAVLLRGLATNLTKRLSSACANVCIVALLCFEQGIPRGKRVCASHTKTGNRSQSQMVPARIGIGDKRPKHLRVRMLVRKALRCCFCHVLIRVIQSMRKSRDSRSGVALEAHKAPRGGCPKPPIAVCDGGGYFGKRG